MADFNKLPFFQGVKKKIESAKKSKRRKELIRKKGANPYGKTGESTFASELLERSRKKK